MTINRAHNNVYLEKMQTCRAGLAVLIHVNVHRVVYMKTETIVRLADYKPFPFEIVSVRLKFALDAHDALVTSTLHIKRKSEIEFTVPLVLDGDSLTLISVTLDGKAISTADYFVAPDHFTMPAAPDDFVLEIVTKLNPAANTALSGLYQSNGNWCTQCEAEGFRRITYYPDRPDVMSVFTVRLEAEKGAAPVLLANGNPVESGELEGNGHFAIWHDPWPKPAYLFALVAGNLALSRDSFVTRSGRQVELGIYTEHGKEHLTLYAMDALKRSMKWDEEKYGCEYDLDVFNKIGKAHV